MSKVQGRSTDVQSRSTRRPRIRLSRLERQIESPAKRHNQAVDFKMNREFLKLQRKDAEKSNPRRRNPDLKKAYTDPESAWEMIEYLGASPKSWHAAAYEYRPFPCIVPNRDDCRAFIKPGKDGQYMYAMLPPRFKDKEPMWVTFGEVLAMQHGYGIADEQLHRHKQILGCYSARVAVDSGVVDIDRTPLPLIPTPVIQQLRNHFELILITEYVDKFGLRIDIARAFTPEPFHKDDYTVMFSAAFRYYWIGEFLMVTVDDKRRHELWKLLQEYKLIDMVRAPGSTFYRFGKAKAQSRYDGARHRQDASDTFRAMNPPRLHIVT